jgi:hypothetical protein
LTHSAVASNRPRPRCGPGDPIGPLQLKLRSPRS